VGSQVLGVYYNNYLSNNFLVNSLNFTSLIIAFALYLIILGKLKNTWKIDLLTNN
jgi:hypothetical protein